VQAGRGKLAEAEESSERALALLTSERLLRSHQYALYLRNRSLLRELQGRLDDAKADISAAEELAEFLGDRYFVIARCLPRLYDIEYRLGNVDGAVALIEEMLSSEFGQMPEIAINGLESLTTLRLLQGDIVRAVAAVRQLLVITRGPTTVWRHIAAAVALQGHVHLAARLLGFVDATPPEIWATDPIEQRSYDLLRTAVCERLPSHIVEDRRAEGKQMTPQDASKEVLAVLT
jgi:tetratricopeptide (TPR) repeat protein